MDLKTAIQEYEKYKSAEGNYYKDNLEVNGKRRLIKRVIVCPIDFMNLPVDTVRDILYNPDNRIFAVAGQSEYEIVFFHEYEFPTFKISLETFLSNFSAI